MAKAEELATKLAYEFLRKGQYSQSAGPVDMFGMGAVAASEKGDTFGFRPELGEFSGLAIQSVAFEQGNDNPCVHIYLTRGSAKQISAVPKEIDGIAIRAHKMGSVTVRPEAAAGSTNRGNIYERNGRICCGTSCGPTSESSSGTLGAIVRIGLLPQLYILSNNHVLAGCNHVPYNQPIMAPSNNDGRADAVAPREVARHFQICELRSGDPHFVKACEADLALGRVDNEGNLSSWQGDSLAGYDTPNLSKDPLSLMRVVKIGRTTGLTSGIVEAKVSTPMAVTYSSKLFKGTIWFKDVWTVRANKAAPIALPGDSGSLVVTEDQTAAVGVIFACNPSGEYAWMIPISCVTSSFGGLNLVRGHGT